MNRWQSQCVFVKQQKNGPVNGGRKRGADNKLLHCPDSRVLFHTPTVSQLHVGISQVTLTQHPTKCTRRTGALLFEHPGLDWWGASLPPFILRSAGMTTSVYAGYRNCYSKSNKCDRPSQCLVIMPRDTANKGKREYIWKYDKVCYVCMWKSWLCDARQI